jgi:hypothetical protein
MNHRKQRATARRRVVSIEVMEEYIMVPIRVEVVSASERGRHVLPVFVDRLRCGQDALKKVEPAPLMGQTIGA